MEQSHHEQRQRQEEEEAEEEEDDEEQAFARSAAGVGGAALDAVQMGAFRMPGRKEQKRERKEKKRVRKLRETFGTTTTAAIPAVAAASKLKTAHRHRTHDGQRKKEGLEANAALGGFNMRNALDILERPDLPRSSSSTEISSSTYDSSIDHIMLETGKFYEGSYDCDEDELSAIEDAEDRDLTHQQLREAAFFVDQGWDGDITDVQLTRLSLWAWSVYGNLEIVRVLLSFLLVLLALFEQPSWCWGPAIDCYAPSFATGPMPLANVPFLPIYASLGVELGLLLALLLMGPLLIFMYKGKPVVLSRFFWFSLALVVVAVIDVLFSFGFVNRPFRLSPWVRPLLFALQSRPGRKGMRSLLVGFLAMLRVLPFLLLLILVFSWFGVLLWHRDSDLWSSFEAALRELHITLTTANFPGVMFPEFANARTTFLFYAAYLTLGLYLLISLITASVYSAFRDELRKEGDMFKAERCEALTKAWNILSPSGAGVSYQRFQRLIHVLNRSYRPGALRNIIKSSGVIWDKMCYKRGKLLSLEEFLRLPKMLSASTRHIDPCKCWPNKHYVRFRNIINSTAFDAAILGIIVGNLITIAIQTAFVLDGSPDARYVAESLFIADLAAFTWFYVMEMILRIVAAGYLSRYLQSNWFDAIVTLVSSALAIALLVARATDRARFELITRNGVLQVFLVGRFLRWVRVFLLFRAVRRMFYAALRLLPLLTRVLVMYIFVYYYLALVGIYLFGGRMWVDHPLVLGTDYAQRQWWPLNWNDMGSAFIVQFALMIVNDGPVIWTAFELVTNPAHRAYFWVAWIILTLVFVNILVSFVIDSIINLTREDTQQVVHKEVTVMRRKLKRAKPDEAVRDGAHAPPTAEGLRRTLVVEMKPQVIEMDLSPDDLQYMMNDDDEGEGDEP